MAEEAKELTEEQQLKTDICRQKIRDTQPGISFQVEVVGINLGSEYIDYKTPEVNCYSVSLKSINSEIDFSYTFKVERGDNVPKIGDTFTVTIN